MRTIAEDLRYALRQMWGRPGFAAVAVVSLALGIGANTAVFSLVDQMLLWKVAARAPERLVRIEEGRSMTYPFFREYRARNEVFAGMFASSMASPTGVRVQGAPVVETARVVYVTGEFFQTLGVGAAAGRVLQPADETTQAPVAAMSHAYWQRRFGGRMDAVGQKITVNAFPVEVAGVAERGFTGIFNTADQADLYLPVTVFPLTTPSAKAAWDTPNMHWLHPMARLREGVSREMAQASLRVLWPQAVQAVNGELVKPGGKARDYKSEKPMMVKPGAGGISFVSSATPYIALLSATGLVLLIACANVANLLLARAAGRTREIAIRTALGASRMRLVRQLMTESALLAAAGGVAGVVLSAWALALLSRWNLAPDGVSWQANPKVMAFALGATALTVLLFGLAPALRATARASHSRLWVGKALIAAQVALTLPLLIAAGLFVKTMLHLRTADIGFAKENVLIVDIDPTKVGYAEHRLRTFYDRLAERARQIPGVRSAALSLMTPMGEFAMSRTFTAEGYQPKGEEFLLAYTNPVTEGYFTTLGIPILLGRDFRAEDEPAETPKDSLLTAIGRSGGGTNEVPKSAARVCAINEGLARKLYGGQSAVGRRLSFFDTFTAERALEIVAVVKDVRHGSVREKDDIGIIYVPSWANGAEPRFLTMRIGGEPGPVVNALRAALREMDADVPLLRWRPLEEYVSASYRSERMVAYLCTAFGLMALALAAVGLYGVMAYAVEQRTKEVGIRMAVGAQVGDIVRMMLRESAAPVAAGVACGLAGSAAALRLVSAMLYGVAAGDTGSVATAVCVLGAVSALAAAIPARRAGRVDPAETLRWG